MILKENLDLLNQDCQSFFSEKTKNILEKIKVISARGDYQSKSANPMDWKKLAFESIIQQMGKKINNIISVHCTVSRQLLTF